jgi:long-subunit fatty acid transport protein
MKVMKQIIFIACMCVTISTFAQNEADILRYSQQYTLGTARSLGAGGAFGATGADYSSSLINPAGLGFYRRSELHLSMALTANVADANYLGSTTFDRRTNFNIPTFGFVLSKMNSGLNGDATDGIVGFNFAFGHHRSNDFQQNLFIEGNNNRSSITDFYVQQSNGIDYRDITASGTESNFSNLAWRGYLTDTFDNSASYYSPWFYGDNNGYNLLQTYQITRRGSTDEFNISGSMNIGNTLFLGAGLVMMEVRQQYKAVFTESDPDRTVNNSLGSTYRYSSLTTEINTEGSGIAGRFGVIFRPVDAFRLGLSAQTPARIALTDKYKYILESDIDYPGIGYNSVIGPEEQMDYELITPARYTLSANVMLTKFGFISADLEMVDYRNGRLTSGTYAFSNENRRAQQVLNEAYILRVGSEFKLDDHWRFRLGYNYASSPYQSNATGVNNADLARQSYSTGFGYTDGHYFLDLAGMLTQFKEYYTPYEVDGGFTPTGVVTNRFYNFVLSTGVRF